MIDLSKMTEILESFKHSELSLIRSHFGLLTTDQIRFLLDVGFVYNYNQIRFTTLFQNNKVKYSLTIYKNTTNELVLTIYDLLVPSFSPMSIYTYDIKTNSMPISSIFIHIIKFFEEHIQKETLSFKEFTTELKSS